MSALAGKPISYDVFGESIQPTSSPLFSLRASVIFVTLCGETPLGILIEYSEWQRLVKTIHRGMDNSSVTPLYGRFH